MNRFIVNEIILQIFNKNELNANKNTKTKTLNLAFHLFRLYLLIFSGFGVFSTILRVVFALSLIYQHYLLHF